MARNLKYPNLTVFFAILFLTFILFQTGRLENFVNDFIQLRYFGVFLSGIFFVLTFTVAPATAVLFLFSERLDPALVALVGGIGAVFGDYAIFRFMKDGLVEELREIFQKIGGDNFFNAHHIFHSKYFLWLSPVIGALIIASPLPDELGIGILGIYKLSNKKFLALSFILNTIGIFLLLGGLRLILD